MVPSAPMGGHWQVVWTREEREGEEKERGKTDMPKEQSTLPELGSSIKKHPFRHVHEHILFWAHRLSMWASINIILQHIPSSIKGKQR